MRNQNYDKMTDIDSLNDTYSTTVSSINLKGYKLNPAHNFLEGQKHLNYIWFVTEKVSDENVGSILQVNSLCIKNNMHTVIGESRYLQLMQEMVKGNQD